MKYKSALITSGSGSINGMTASRNAGGNYMRARAVPTNPNTPLQAVVREVFGMLSNAWAGLTQPQRDAWAQYAKNVPLINTLGDSIKVTALNMFIRGNSPRIQAGLPIVEDGPTIFNLGETPMIESAEGTVGGLAPQIQVDLEAGDAADNWLLYLGKPVSPTINFFRGPFRFTTTDVATAANLSIAAADYPFPYAAGQKVVARVVRSSGDGRLSAEAQATFLLTVGT